MRLVRPVVFDVEGGRLGYWFVTGKGRREPRKTRLFRAWLRTEMPDSVGGYVEQMGRSGGRS